MSAYMLLILTQPVINIFFRTHSLAPTASDSVIGSIWRRAFYEIDVSEKTV